MSAIRCPRCSKPCTTRLRHLKGISGGMGVGLVVVLLLPFLRQTYCPDHGKIPTEEFPATDLNRMRRRTAIRLVVTVALLAVAVGLLVVALPR